MKRTLLTAAALSALFAFGCDDKNQAPTPEAQKAADNAADSASKNLSDAKSAVGDATSAAKDQAAAAADATKNQANAMKDQAVKDESAAKSGADVNQSNLDALISKAKDAVKDKKWSDADNYVKQIEDLKAKLPADQQPKVDTALAGVKSAIEMGKKMMPGT